MRPGRSGILAAALLSACSPPKRPNALLGAPRQTAIRQLHLRGPGATRTDPFGATTLAWGTPGDIVASKDSTEIVLVGDRVERIRHSFKGSANAPARFPSILDFASTKEAASAVEVARALPYSDTDSDGKNFQDFALRTIAWRHGEALWRATVISPLIRIGPGRGRPANPQERHVVAYEIAAGRFEDPNGELDEQFREPLVGMTSPALEKGLGRPAGRHDSTVDWPPVLDAKTFSERRVSVLMSNGVASAATVEWTGDRSEPDAFGYVPLDRHADLTVSGEGIDRTLDWISNGVRYHVTAFCPEQRVYRPAAPGREDGFETRAAHADECRAIRVEERAEGDPRPLAPRVGITPVASFQHQPPYPPSARAADAEGAAVFKIEVSESGAVVEIRTLRAHPFFELTAARTVATWRYKPVLADGEPIRWSGTITCNFRLRR